MRLLGAVFLCTGLVNLVQGKVVTSFDECNQFFVAGQPPTFDGLNIPDEHYRLICQTQNPDPTAKDYEYVTLYHTKMKIPLYSAYKFQVRTTKKKVTRDAAWKIEPQLDGGQLPSMTQRKFSGIPVDKKVINQAVNKDYEGSHYDKGHLYPVNHAHDQNAAKGTFTLTNAAPQTCMFNKEWYFEVEFIVSSKLKDCPPGYAYVVTGVIPSDKYINDRVNVPSHFWTAYCCMGFFSGSFIMSATDLKASEDLDLTLFRIEPFGGKC